MQIQIQFEGLTEQFHAKDCVRCEEIGVDPSNMQRVTSYRIVALAFSVGPRAVEGPLMLFRILVQRRNVALFKICKMPGPHTVKMGCIIVPDLARTGELVSFIALCENFSFCHGQFVAEVVVE